MREQPLFAPRIIVVEDDVRVRRMVARMVRRSFPDVTICESGHGDEALDLIDDRTLCVISDVNMPGCDGLHMCRSLRQSAAFVAWRDIPVVLMTADVSDELVVERAWQAGTAFLLQKPFSEGELLDAMRQACGQRATPAMTTSRLALRSPDADEAADGALVPQLRALPPSARRVA